MCRTDALFSKLLFVSPSAPSGTLTMLRLSSSLVSKGVTGGVCMLKFLVQKYILIVLTAKSFFFSRCFSVKFRDCEVV